MISLTVDARLLIDCPSTLEGRIKDKNIPCTQVFTAFSMRLTCLQPDAAFNMFGAKVKNVLILLGQLVVRCLALLPHRKYDLTLNLPFWPFCVEFVFSP